MNHTGAPPPRRRTHQARGGRPGRGVRPDAGAVYRVGGDEFAACCFDLDEARGANVAERIRAACARHRAQGLPLSMSVGWALRLPGERVEDLLLRADRRMYEEKQRARAGR